MMTAGIDCGARNTKAVILVHGGVIGQAGVLTGTDPAKSAEDALTKAAEAAGIARKDIGAVGGTGSGKNAVQAAAVKIEVIEAMGRGAMACHPNVRTVADVGAEEARAARLDDQGRPEDFVVNEKCAAGAGVFVEAMGRALDTPIEDMGDLALASTQPLPMNAQCAVFAESEVVGLIHSGAKKEDISRAIHEAMAGRIATMIRRIGVNEDVVLIGGVARNVGFVQALKRELGLETVFVPEDPDYVAALGAAFLAGVRA